MSEAGAPIGIFDSGLGGLTIVKAVRDRLPGESVIYYGDTAHLPYGDKSPELIREYCGKITRFLREQGVKAIVIACNTASAVARDAVEAEAGDLPVIDVIGPAVDAALENSPGRSIGIIGTKTTIHSGVYGRRIREQIMSARVIEKATPLLVPIIEEGWVHNAISREVIEAYMSDTGFREIDTLILGCTHYPLIKEEVAEFFRKNFERDVIVIDSSIAVADRINERLGELGLLAREGFTSSHHFYVSDLTANFESSARIFLEDEIELEKI